VKQSAVRLKESNLLAIKIFLIFYFVLLDLHTLSLIKCGNVVVLYNRVHS